ncbi:MAG: ferredoxin [Candidatus Marinamargulisbacteria bacterium]
MKQQHSFKILNHCIACTTCSTMAPHTFTLDLPAQMAIITNQPSNAIEYAKSMAALKSCPVSAIGVERP